MATSQSTGDRVFAKSAYGKFFHATVCRYEKADGRALAYFKRLSARVARRNLARALRRETAEDDSASPAWR